MSEQLALLPAYGTAHLQLSLAALCLGAFAAIPLGIAIHRRRALEPALLGAASAVQTIPALALLAVMVPLFAALGARAIGAWPALVALTLYGLLPILRNTVTGLAGVDPAVREAARGVGMTPREELWRVELPLALPVIVAGVRTAAVWVVGTATLATPIGATSLGNYIFTGLATRNDAAVLVGCVASAALALGLDQLIRLLEAGIRARRRAWWGTAVVLLGALALYAGASAVMRTGRGDRAIAIGAKAFTEQLILAEILGQQVAARTGAATRTLPSLGSTVAFDALAAGDLDLYVDYSGTIFATIMHGDTASVPRGEILEQVERYLSEEHGIAMAGALGFENSYALAMRGDRARELGVTQIGELARRAPELEIGGDYEFFARAEWRALVAAYGLAFRGQRAMDPSLMYDALRTREVDVISAFSTDGLIAADGLAVLADERGVIPPSDAIVLVSARLARERPDALAALRELAGAIDADAMRRMNSAVDADGRAPAEVAREFLAGR